MKCRVKNETMSEKTLRHRLKYELFTENAVLRNINQIKYDIQLYIIEWVNLCELNDYRDCSFIMYDIFKDNVI